MSTVMEASGDVGSGREDRVRALFSSLRESLAHAAAAPLDMSHAEAAIRLAQALRAELIGGQRP